MGLTIKSDLDTSRGSSQEVYIRIESCRVNKVLGEMEFTTTLWVSENSAKNFYKTYVDDSIGNAEGIIKQEVVYYTDENDIDGVEVKIPNHFKIGFTKEVITEEPIYEVKLVKKKIPYISFDKEGNEIEKVKIVSKEENVQVGTNKTSRLKIDYDQVDRPFVFAYNHIKKELKKLLPGVVIE